MIPEMTDWRGKYWKQPSREEIAVDGSYALMSPGTFGQLAEYSTTLPSGVYEGKMWKRYSKLLDPPWVLCWFGPSSIPDNCAVEFRQILIVKP